ncbi:hypothetical protein AX16_001412 [Volvariella volvacea WC 439]|nr:hypothetical protein AX16_001412 [Volvariella volvacea WC 439]
MPAPDAHTRNKISLNPAKVLTSSIPSKFLPRIFLSNLVFVFALHASKEWLLNYEVGVFWLLMRVFACGGLGAIFWEVYSGHITSGKSIEWSVLGMASVLLFVQQGCLFTALYRLSPIRVILFIHFSSLWMTTFLTVTSTKKALAVASALVVSILTEAHFSTQILWRLVPGYGAVVIHAFASTALDHTYGVLSPSLGINVTIAGSVLGATVLFLPFYLFRTVVLNLPPSPVVPLFSLAVIPIAAYSVLFLTPSTAHTLGRLSFITQYFSLSYPTIVVSSVLTGILIFTHLPTWTDFIVAGLLYAGTYPETVDAFSGPPRDSTSRLIRTYMKTILSNPESRKIFYFLMLNMCYMLVQMLYGVWTNSLGLISDAIHMAFDCMAIGVGLFASVMATWEPNERFTYGYGRIETLSGFANGVFLILISIFIIFEAIQRIMEPPEMNTSQLLLVSTLGLAVNLFGMFAMGGHHHHV